MNITVIKSIKCVGKNVWEVSAILGNRPVTFVCSRTKPNEFGSGRVFAIGPSASNKNIVWLINAYQSKIWAALCEFVAGKFGRKVKPLSAPANYVVPKSHPVPVYIAEPGVSEFFSNDVRETVQAIERRQLNRWNEAAKNEPKWF